MSLDDLGSNIDQPIKVQRKRKEAAPQADAPEERVRIILDDNEDIPPIGAFFGVNGVGYIIKPNMEVNVPISVIRVIDNAVMEVPEIDPETKQVIGYRTKRRYSYRRV